MRQTGKIFLLTLSLLWVTLSMSDLSAQGLSRLMLDNGLAWSASKLIIASDYDPLLRDTANPDRGARKLQETLRSTLEDVVEQRNFCYMSLDEKGDSVLLSACLLLPREGEVRGLVVANHYTVCADAEAPTRAMSFDALFCLKGYAVMMADYIGYGKTADRVHPYLHVPTESRTVVDMILHVFDNEIGWVKTKTKSCKKSSDTSSGARGVASTLCGRKLLSDSIVMIGYSQGAAVSVATAQLIAEHYADLIPLRAVYAGGGPYDPASMYDKWVSDDYTAIPYAIPLTILGMDAGEQLHLDLAGLFREPLLSHYKEWITSKRYTVNQLEQLMVSHHLSDHMPPEGMDKTVMNTALFYHAMQRQSLLSFRPQVPLFLFHSTEDQWVPSSGSERLAEAIGNDPLLTTDFGAYGNHPIAIVAFYQRLWNRL